MQRLSKMTLIVFCLLASFSWADGGIDAGGGDSYVAEIRAIAEELIDAIREVRPEQIQESQLRIALDTTQIASVDRLQLNGIEVDAINYPSRKFIQFSRSRWDQIKNDQVKRYTLVLHEFLGILRIPDNDYRLSSKVIGQYDLPKRNVVYRCKIKAGDEWRVAITSNRWKTSMRMIVDSCARSAPSARKCEFMGCFRCDGSVQDYKNCVEINE